MKFARYLEETQTPEWKRAYIDYRGLKKQIAAIRQERAAGPERHSLRNTPARAFNHLMSRSSTTSVVATSPVANQSQGDAQPLRSGTSIERNAQHARSTLTFRTTPTAEGMLDKTPVAGLSGKVYGTFLPTPTRASNLEGTSPPEFRLPSPIQSVPEQREPEEARAPRRRRSSFALPPPALPAPPETAGASPRRPRVSIEPHKRRPSLFAYLTPSRIKLSTPRSDRVPATLAELYYTLSPLERDFFNCLDLELSKVDQFFVARGRDVQIKASALRGQLQKLELHRKLFHEYSNRQSRFTNLATIAGVSKLMQLLHQGGTGNEQEESNRSPKAPAPSPSGYFTAADDAGPEAAIETLHLEPEEYQPARRELKKAVLELYRGVELLHNYRILNLTGFRKALKKYEKITGRQVSQLYHQEKIQSSVFAESTNLSDLLKELEHTYTARFAGGDQKKARLRLRAPMRDGSHHFSTFRSGLCIGLSLAALASGIYESLQDHTRAAIPEWFGLLQVYMVLFVPVVFGLLLALNIVTWSRYRINYVFIFALDVRTALSPHEYLELPAFLFLTLSHCFWFSFSGFPSQVSPTRWPLMWIIFTILVMINPLPVLYRSSRMWLLRTLGSLFVSGSRGVEFKDFFLGDQLCSMVYTISSLYSIGCAYRYEWEHPLEECTRGNQWIIIFVFSALPSLIRLIQCIKRYADSGVVHHLVNGGKYTAGVVYYLLYLYWRSRGSTYDYIFAIWIVWAVFSSTYSAAWDLMMDWSVLSKEPRYPLLRKQLIYVNHAWVYYIAVTTNVVLRFCWIIYVTPGGPQPALRSGIVASLEALRRFQWNFFRVENEHLGNADQYRVTREIPLPYQFDHPELSDDQDQNDGTQPRRKLGRRQAASMRQSTIDRED